MGGQGQIPIKTDLGKLVEINNLNKWMSGKIVKWVDTSVSNCIHMGFYDNSVCLMETELIGWGIYGPTYYEEIQDAN